MDFTIGEEDRLLQQSVRDFVEEQVNSRWREIEEREQIPDEVIAGARELGLLGLSIPEKYGGMGLSVVQKALVHEMLGRGPWGLSTYISVHTGIGCVGIVRFGSEEQKQKYLPKMASGEWIGSFALTEPNAGSDAGAMQSTAVKKGNEWILNGTKTFITNAPKAHHFMVFAKSDKGICAFLVDREAPGVRIGQVFKTIGHKGSTPAEVVMEDSRVPLDALVGEEGKGFEYAKRCLSEGRTTLATRCVGTAQKAMELALEYGEARKTFGKSLTEHQALAFRFAQMSARTEATRLCCYRAAWLLDQGKPAVRESSTAKLLGGEWSFQTVDECMQIFGGNGYISGEYMIERLWRDLRVARVYDGSSEVQQMVIAGQLRKGDVLTAW
ncbi:MAG TPA: acyl-CoA dehydrogenase family protein [Polyangiales bacterium]|jgi:acyl-CoA dehydrogenase|nr:acyl-CoA dehydrogenase family protein [Polyangiales bacterium]